MKLTILLLICDILLTCVNAQCTIEADSYIQRYKALDGTQFWNAKTDDIGQCARMCLRRKMCKSFNFNIHTYECELNWDILENGESLSGSLFIYSAIAKWPSAIDPDCFSRPCAVDEVCIPGTLADGSPQCSYACIKLRLVCPKPSVSVSGERSIGSVITFNCNRGYIGGDTADCLETTQWSNEIDTSTCTPLYKSACNADAECSDIDGVCTNGRCDCGGGKTYDANDVRCASGIRWSSSGGGDKKWSGVVEMYNTEDGKWKTLVNDHWDYKATRLLCRDLNPEAVFGGSFHETEPYGSGDSNLDVYELHNLDCSGATTSLLECNYEFKAKAKAILGITCYNVDVADAVRLVNEDGNFGSTVMEGRVEVLYNGMWSPVCNDGWGNKETDVVCKSLNPAWKEDGGKGATDCEEGIPRITNHIKCDDHEDNLMFCRNMGWNIPPDEECDCDKTLKIKCKTA